METIKIKEVCPTSTLELIKRNYLLIDVREENEFHQFSFDVPRVLHIPLSKLEERMNEIPKDEKVILLLKCLIALIPSPRKLIRSSGFGGR